MTFMGKYTLILLALFATSLTCQSFDLASLERHALPDHPIFSKFSHAQNEKGFTQKKIMSGYLPTASASYQASRWSNHDKIGHESTLQLRQRLFDGTKQSRLKTARHDYCLAQLKTKQATKQITFEIEQAFLQAWLTQEKERLVRSIRQSAKQQFDREKELKSLGMSDRTTFLSAAAAYAGKLELVKRYEHELAQAFAALEKACSTTFTDEMYPRLTWDFHQSKTTDSLENSLKRALHQRSDLHAFDHEIESWKNKVTITKASYLPKIDLYENLYHTKNTPNSTLYNNFTHVTGLALKWDFFDAGYNYYEAQKAESKILQLKDEQQTKIDAISQQTRQTWHDLKVKHWQSSVQDLELTRNWAEFEHEICAFDHGLIDKTDMLKAHTSWHDAQFAWLSNRIALAIAQAIFQNSVGDN